ncbi:MAG: 30S ribosomal protein S9 [Alphaproteobacteria bacterium]|nr:30S ribosomal protein S9 [Alphaproteobacteria bacterium]
MVKETIKTTKKAGLADLKQEVAAAAETVATEQPVAPREPKKDKFGRSQSVGKKKNAIARVIIKMGKGNIVVNGRSLEDYFPRPALRMIINQPFALTAREGQFDVQCNVAGGGLAGQAYALRHGISRCLDMFEPELHTALKKAGFLTRDSRVVERKKPGRPKARKRFQFSKR